MSNDKLHYQQGREPLYCNTNEKHENTITDELTEAISELKKIMFKIIIGKKIIIFDKSEIQDIKLEHFEKSLNLLIILDERQISIGNYLNKLEKEWLSKIMTQWLHSNEEYK